MASLRLPLAGDVTQFIRSWIGLFSQRDGQIGLFNVNVDLGKTDAPEVETDILQTVGTYGHQLGRIGDALAVLVRHVDPARLTPEEDKALKALARMLDDLADVREKHGRKALRPVYPPPAPPAPAPAPAIAPLPAAEAAPAAAPKAPRTRPATPRKRKTAATPAAPETPPEEG